MRGARPQRRAPGRRGGPARLGPVGVAGLLGVLLAGCGDEVEILECPRGTRPVEDHCEPWQSPASDAEGSDGRTDSRGEPDGRDVPARDPDAGGGDAPPAAEVDGGSPPDGASPDAGADGDVASGPGAIGTSCQVGSDCAGGTCLDWPGGYCSQLGCEVVADGEGDDGCPDGSRCVPVRAGNRACLRTCGEGGEACREGGEQACKPLAVGEGEATLRVCHGVGADPSGIGAPCDRTVDCAGPASCLQAFPGGYCGIRGCEAGTCPETAACVELNGRPTCLRRCGADADCTVESEEAERQCNLLETVADEPIEVCTSGSSGAPIGAPCSNDLSCASGTCQIVGEGRCSQSEAPCFPETEETDCTEAGFCATSEVEPIGVCTRPCSVGTGCPGTTFCVGEPGEPQGRCRASCDDGSSCAGDAGFECTYGVPLGESDGRFVCHRARDGEVGTPCSPEEEGACGDGTCTPSSEGSGGTCTRPCGEDDYCPFPGICATVEGSERCRRACFSATDCPAGTGCTGPEEGGLVDVCQ